MKTWTGGQYMAWGWTENTLNLLIILLRIYVDHKGLRKVARHRDALLLFGCLVAITSMGMHSWSNDKNFFNPLVAPESYSKGMKIQFVDTILSATLMYCCKVDLLFLYHELAPRAHHPRIFYLILGGWLVVVGCWLAFFIGELLMCKPISAYWHQDQSHLCKFNSYYYYTYWLTTMLSEITVYAIPCVIIYRLSNLSFSYKLSAAAMFFVGFINMFSMSLTIAVSVIAKRRVEKAQLAGDMDAYLKAWNLYGAAFFISATANLTAVVVVCMPQMKSAYLMVRGKVTARKGREGGDEGTDDTRIQTPAAGEVVYANKIEGVSGREKSYEVGSQLESGRKGSE